MNSSLVKGSIFEVQQVSFYTRQRVYITIFFKHVKVPSFSFTSSFPFLPSSVSVLSRTFVLPFVTGSSLVSGNTQEDNMEDPTTRPLLASDEEESTNNGIQEESRWSGDQVKSMVYAGLDAILTSFSLIFSISATQHSSGSVLVLGLANLVADGISMGFGDFVSSRTEQEMVENERSSMERAVRRHIRPQLSELLDAYQSLGMTLEDATTVMSVFSKYRNILLDEKMTTQKGMLPPRNIEPAWKTGLITFVSFLLFGFAPLISFIVLIPFTGDYTVKFSSACVLSALALALLGAARARISGQNYGYAVTVTLFNGCVAAAAAYSVSWGLRNLAGVDQEY